MTNEVKIVSFRLDDHDPRRAEKELTALVKQGWVIVTAGAAAAGMEVAEALTTLGIPGALFCKRGL